MCRVLLLSDANSSHTQKWVFSLAENGMEIGLFSLGELNTASYKNKKNITVFCGEALRKNNFYNAEILKISYLSALPALKRAIKEFKPDIIHAHYATSYGLLGALSKYRPLIISVWGSDVYDFPNKSFLHKSLLKYNLGHADVILSTSKVMAAETTKYTSKDIVVTPFGIDVNAYKPSISQLATGISIPFKSTDFIVGTIKALESKYGIEFLVKAFCQVIKHYPEKKAKLLIVGKGTLADKLKLLVKDLNIEPDVCFTGYIEHEKKPAIHNIFQIEVFPSISESESFGVSVLEASACAKPVIASKIGGLAEVIEEGVTGILVPPANVEKLAEAIEKLLLDEELRKDMGAKGRARVEQIYNWDDCVKQMVGIYKKVLKNKQ
jgi:glycosyltransferase involved in cell wall biosynthesis